MDEQGHVVNGDQMIAIFARQMKAEGRLPGDAAVTWIEPKILKKRKAAEEAAAAAKEE